MVDFHLGAAVQVAPWVAARVVQWETGAAAVRAAQWVAAAAVPVAPWVAAAEVPVEAVVAQEVVGVAAAEDQGAEEGIPKLVIPTVPGQRILLTMFSQA